MLFKWLQLLVNAPNPFAPARGMSARYGRFSGLAGFVSATSHQRKSRSWSGIECLEQRVLLTISPRTDTIRFLANEDVASAPGGEWTSQTVNGAIDAGGTSVLRNDTSTSINLAISDYSVQFITTPLPVGFSQILTPPLPPDPDFRFFAFDPTANPAHQSLPAGQIQIYAVQYTVSNGVDSPESAYLFIHVVGVNDPPNAVSDSGDSFAVTEDTVLGGGGTGGDAGGSGTNLLENDSDPDGDTFRVTGFSSISQPYRAAVNVLADGTFTYDPTNSADLQSLNEGETVTDQFEYTVTDTTGASATGQVSLVVTGVNDAPIANADTYTTDEDSVLSGTFDTDANDSPPGLLDNDVDVDSNDNIGANVVTTASFISSQLGAAVSIAPDGSFSYDPTDVDAMFALSEGEHLVDTFTYTLTDPAGAESTGTVSIRVEGRNDHPVAVDDNVVTTEDTIINAVPGTFGLLDNDLDVDIADVVGATVRARVATIPSQLLATVRINANGSYTYDPLVSAHLQGLNSTDPVELDSFSYTIVDSTGLESVGQVTITVTGNDDPIVASPDFAETDENSDIFIDVLANDRAPDWDDKLPHPQADPDLLLDQDDSITPNVFPFLDNPVSQRGADVSVDPTDYRIYYDPRNSFELQRLLAGGQAVVDTFSYYLQTSQVPSERTPSVLVQVVVTGVDDDTDPPVGPINEAPIPGKPVLALQRDANGGATALSWQPVANADRYELLINDSEGNRVVTINSLPAAQTSLALPNTLGNEDHTAYLRAFNSDNVSGHWSDGVAVNNLSPEVLDLDGNGEFTFATDGIIILAHSLGTANSGLEGFRGLGFTRTGSSIDGTLDQLEQSGALDIDGDGTFVFANDGVLILAYSLGTRGAALETFRSNTSTLGAASLEARLVALLGETAGARTQSPDAEETGFATVAESTNEISFNPPPVLLAATAVQDPNERVSPASRTIVAAKDVANDVESDVAVVVESTYEAGKAHLLDQHFSESGLLDPLASDLSV